MTKRPSTSPLSESESKADSCWAEPRILVSILCTSWQSSPASDRNRHFLEYSLSTCPSGAPRGNRYTPGHRLPEGHHSAYQEFQFPRREFHIPRFPVTFKLGKGYFLQIRRLRLFGSEPVAESFLMESNHVRAVEDFIGKRYVDSSTFTVPVKMTFLPMEISAG